jgi:pimeloyl-ACP methyl ester carboxylesterase
MQFQDHFVKTPSGHSIHYWYFPAENSKGLILFFHGNGENMSTHFLLMSWLPKENYSYVVFDYPGYGFSSGEPTQESTVESGVTMIKEVTSKWPSEKFFVYGQSLGGIVAMRSVQEWGGEPQALIVESSFSSYQRMARRVLSRHWLTWIFQPLAWVLVSDQKAVEDTGHFSPIPLLFIHGDADRVVEPINSQEMFAQSIDPKELWIVPGGGHSDTYFKNDLTYRQKLINYLDQYRDRPLKGFKRE